MSNPALFKGRCILDYNSNVRFSHLSNNTIDMSNNVITNVANPTLFHHAANKFYVDNVITSRITLEISLSSTSYSEVYEIFKGDIDVSVSSIVSGGPSARFNLTKNLQASYPGYTRLSSSASSSGERLEMIWEPNEKPKLRKTGVNFDGLYRLKISVND